MYSDDYADHKPIIAIMTLGCKVNFFESEKLMQRFLEEGFEIAQFSEFADVYIVNTCTVTNIADRKSRKMLHRAKRINESAIVVALGCFAQAKGESLLDDAGIDIVIGNDRKECAYEIIVEELKKRSALPSQRSVQAADDKADDIKNGMHIQALPDERTRAYVKIQDGCNQFCSYCKIPYVRGKLKSTDRKEVLDHISKLADRGYKEVVLTGIHLSSYGVDLDDSKRNFVELEGEPLLELISSVAGIEGIKRIRLGSLEPRIITGSFVEKLSQTEKICPHFHLSLQSGCDATLERMNRKYTAKEYLEACGILRRYFDKPAITTDIIVGFPGETKEDFMECMEFARRVHFSDMHVFKYSQRDGTLAANMADQVPEMVKNKRSAMLIDEGKKLTAEYINGFIGKVQTCLVEEKITFNGESCFTGHNERYVKLVFKADPDSDIENTLVEVVPVSIMSGGMLYCELNT